MSQELSAADTTQALWVGFDKSGQGGRATSCALDRTSTASLHVQLASIIRERIRSGEWGAGFRIPSEHELQQVFGLARGTVRRAIGILVEEGLLIQEHGRGTFVAANGIYHHAGDRMLSVAAALRDQGRSFVTHVLDERVLKAPTNVAAQLAINPGSEVLFLRRVRDVSGRPSVCQESWLNLSACPGLEEADFSVESAFDAVQRCSGRKIVSSRLRYSARTAGVAHGHYLDCAPSEPVLVLEQLISLDNHVPIEWSLTWFCRDQYVAGISTQVADGAPSATLDQLPQSFPAADTYAAPEAGQLSRSQLEALALRIRRGAIQFALIDPAHPYHLGGSMSCVEILAALYGDVMHTGADATPWTARDRLVFSKGHGALSLYPALEYAGLLSHADIAHGLYGPAAVVYKHPRRDPARGIELSAGSLGMGPGFAAGIALANKRRGREGRVFCLVGDGECNEGSVWEALQFVGHTALDNFVLIVDANGLQLDGPTADILGAGSLAGRLSACGLEVVEVDGHDVIAIRDALRPRGSQPLALICHTHKGKGLSFACDVVRWHDERMSEDERAQAMAELGITEG